MKRLLILLILTFLFAGNIFSQDSSKSNEIGLYFTSTYRYGLRYKHGNENLMFRITALRFTSESYKAEYYEDDDYNADLIGLAINFGLEMPISITDKFNFFFGPELSGEYSYEEYTYSDDSYFEKTYEYRLGVIIGFAYKFTPEFIISAEVVPSTFYRLRKRNKSESKTFGFELKNDYAGIAVGYRF